MARQTVLISIGDSIPAAVTGAEVVFDNEAGVSEALHLLAAAGHRRIAVLTSTDVSTPDRPAEVVVHRIAAQLGLHATVQMAPHDLDGASAVARTLLSTPDRPTAVFCLADSMAYGVYAAARELSLSVPDDVSVLGYDDHPVSRLLTPPLSSFRWPVDLLVSTVVERMVRAVEDDKRSRRKVLTPVAQVRGSIAPPRTART